MVSYCELIRAVEFSYSGVASCVATTVFLIGELLGPGAESSALPLPSLPGFTGYDAVQNRFSGQVGVNFETLEAMGHS